MLTGNVIMLKDDIGLLAIAKCLHILLRNLHEPFIRKFLVRVRIEGTVEHRILCPALIWDKLSHIGQYLFHRVFAVLILVQTIGKQDGCLFLPYLLEVVPQCSSKVCR